VEGSGEHDNEPSGSLKCWEVLVAAQQAASQEGLSSMELAKIRSHIVCIYLRIT
jgi:hypothetical protein